MFNAIFNALSIRKSLVVFGLFATCYLFFALSKTVLALGLCN